MRAPLYDMHNISFNKPDNAHSGLWFERFFNRYDERDWTKVDDTAKQAWIKTVTGSTGDFRKLEAFTNRQIALTSTLDGISRRYTSDWNFITGMGNSHPVENGFSWHPTLAVPFLTGASVKGLVRAWVEMNDEELKPEALKQRLKSWFGTEEKGDVAEQAGDIIFFDALPDEPPKLACDIMTPHMGKWYSEGDKPSHDASSIPADWHEPVPIPFLVTKDISLVFHIAPRARVEQGEISKVLSALTNALDYLGAGAKTAAGYGYFSEDMSFQETLQAKQIELEKAKSEAQHRASLSPFELSLEDFLSAVPESEQDTRLLKALKEGMWEGHEAKVVANKIQSLMTTSKKWMPDFAGTNKKKLKLKERSVEVQSYLKS